MVMCRGKKWKMWKIIFCQKYWTYKVATLMHQNCPPNRHGTPNLEAFGYLVDFIQFFSNICFFTILEFCIEDVGTRCVVLTKYEPGVGEAGDCVAWESRHDRWEVEQISDGRCPKGRGAYISKGHFKVSKGHLVVSKGHFYSFKVPPPHKLMHFS